MQKLKAMVLAAGIGERLKPLTLTTPKPLIKVADKTLIERQIIKLKKAGFEDIIINLHHLAKQIKTTLGDGSKYGVNITYSFEEVLLDTAGGIAKALPFFNDGAFALISADVVSDFDFNKLADFINSSTNKNLIVLVDNPAHHKNFPNGDFYFSQANKKVYSQDDELAKKNKNLTSLTFSGFAVFLPNSFSNIIPSEAFPLKPILTEQALQDNLLGKWHNKVYFDCGSLERLKSAERWLIENE